MSRFCRRQAIPLLLALLIASAVLVCFLSACDETEPIRFTLPTYTQHVGEQGKNPDGLFGASKGLNFTLSLSEPQYYTVAGIGSCNDRDIVIPDTNMGKPVTGIEPNAFRDNDRLRSVYMGGYITSIGANAFADCNKLLSVTLGEGLQSIGKNAFAGCHCLWEVGNYSSLNIQVGEGEHGMIGFYAKNVYTAIDGQTKLFVDEPYVLYREGNRNILVASLHFDSIIQIRDNVDAIGDYAFYEDSSLHYVSMSPSVTAIGRCAFRSCHQLESVSIGTGVVSIDAEAFYRCTQLANLEFGANVASVGRLAFAECNLRAVTLPDSLYDLGEYAFADNERLRTVQLGKNVLELDKTVWRGCGLHSVTFATANHWFRTQNVQDYESKSGGVETDVQLSPEDNAAWIAEGKYYWYKKRQ